MLDLNSRSLSKGNLDTAELSVARCFDRNISLYAVQCRVQISLAMQGDIDEELVITNNVEQFG